MKPKKQQKGGQLDDKRQQRRPRRARLVADQRVTAINASDPIAKKAASKDNSTPKDVVIDVIVAYTKKAANNYSDVKREFVELSIQEANESFRQSGIGQVKLHLVRAYQTDYVEEGAHFDHVWRFADKGDGYMEEIHPLREKYHADVAVLIVVDPEWLRPCYACVCRCERGICRGAS
jgi:hypothetical protein